MIPKAIAAVLLIVLLLTGVVLTLARMDTSMSRIRESGVIRIGYAVEAPYAFVKAGGEVTGEAPEVARRIASRLGIGRIEWRQTEFGNLITELETGQIDVVAAGMFITRARSERVAFSRPSSRVSQALLVRKGNPQNLHSYEDARDEGNVRLAVLSGAVEQGLLLRMGMPEARLLAVPDAATGLAAVEAGQADGLALSAPSIRWMASHDQLGGTEMAQPFTQPAQALHEHLGYAAFAFRHEDVRLRQAWDATMRGFIGSPEHLDLIDDFGFTPEEFPGDITTETILSK